MANIARRKIKGGKMFVPMNMNGYDGDRYHFFSSAKLAVLAIIVVLNIIWQSVISNMGLTIVGRMLFTAIGLLVSSKVIRKYIIEEDYFYKLYLKQQELTDTAPDIFWNISSVRIDEDGALLIFNDMKIGCMLRLERDTIVGKADNSSEKHFDAWSDFYNELHQRKLSIIQLNLMESSVKDSRLNTLGLVSTSCSNNNIKRALELEVEYLKRIGTSTLTETDYIMVYTDRSSRISTLLQDVADCTYKLLDGAYSSVKIMTEKEIYALPKDLYNVEFFDGIQAQMRVYKSYHDNIDDAFKIKRIKIANTDGFKIIDIDSRALVTLEILATAVNNGYIEYGKWSVDEALDGKLDDIIKNRGNHATSAQSAPLQIVPKKLEKVKKLEKKGLFKKKKNNNLASDNKEKDIKEEKEEVKEKDIETIQNELNIDISKIDNTEDLLS